jgi:hypothetical protein
MGQAIRGAAGSGSVDVYTVPRDHELRLEILTFAIVTDATAGVHKALVTFTDSSIDQTTGFLRDLNEGGPLQTLTYTYGIGLNGSACVAVTGWQMTDALPDTILAPETVITVTAVNDAGSTHGSDVITAVTLFGDLDDFVARQAVAGTTSPFDIVQIPDLIYSPPASGTTYGLPPDVFDVFGDIQPGLLPGQVDG